MAGLDPAIHVFCTPQSKTWMPGVKPGHDGRCIWTYPHHQFTACNFRTLGAVRWAMLSTTPPPSFRAHYQALVASGAIEADPAQAGAADAFAALEDRLSSY